MLTTVANNADYVKDSYKTKENCEDFWRNEIMLVNLHRFSWY